MTQKYVMKTNLLKYTLSLYKFEKYEHNASLVAFELVDVL